MNSTVWTALFTPLFIGTFASIPIETNAAGGVPLLNFDQASLNQTELGSEYKVEASNRFEPRWRLLAHEGDPFARLSFKRRRSDRGRPRLEIALWGQLEQQRLLPLALREVARGLSVELAASCASVVRARLVGADGRNIASANWQVGSQRSRHRLVADIGAATGVVLEFDTDHHASTCRTISIDVDDVVIENGVNTPFTPPGDEAALLEWLSRSSFNFFDWNYVETGPDEAVVLERQDQLDQVSSSGQGYAIAIYIIGAENGYIERSEAQTRVSSIVNWLYEQEWSDGANGWHGFPYHWYQADKSPHWPAVSTIDWAMLAAGLRVARQYYVDDPALVAKITEILARPHWAASLRTDGRIGMGFHAEDGTLDPYSWGLAFSEESELVYLEALASDPSIENLFNNVERRSRFGLCPSWFASGFTYNWMQLWTGPIGPLAENSRRAFALDLHTNLKAFDRPLIGLTAMQTMTAVDENGFYVSPRYFSNQGAVAHLTPNDDEVVQIAPAPYGAALALPFLRAEAIEALREYVRIGYYHEHLGLPDSVLLAGLPEGIRGIPSYRHLDLNIGAMGLAIDQAGEGIIPKLYRADPEVAAALQLWGRHAAPDLEQCYGELSGTH